MKLLNDLTNLDKAIEHLGEMCGVKHDSLVTEKSILEKIIPLRTCVHTLMGKMECETILKTNDIIIARGIVTGETLIKVHQHPEFQIICCSSGEAYIANNGKLEHLGPGEHTLIPPNFRHGIYFPNDSQLMVVTFPPDTINPEPDNEI